MIAGYRQVSMFGGAVEGELVSTAAGSSDILLVPDYQEVQIQSGGR
jgi:hypothetical protein